MTTITLVKTSAEAVAFLQFIKSDLSNYPNRYSYRNSPQAGGSVIFFLEFTSPEEAYYFGMRHATAQFGY